MLEALIAYHCAPALAGIKPANIVACQKSRFHNLYAEIDALNNQLNIKDIYIETVCECKKRVLLIVYRKNILERHLKSDSNAIFLSYYGYPTDRSLTDYLNILRKRLDCDSFPHEIGVFLGYPLHDIYGFIHHRDEGCLLTGEWKVYRNVEEAEKLFGRFKSCRKALLQHVTERGKTLAQIFCEA